MASDDLRARLAEALDGVFTTLETFDAETAADAVIAIVQPELDRRDKRIEDYRKSRQRWMDAAYADRRAANRAAEERNHALAALEAVRDAQSLGQALAAVAAHDGLTRDLVTEPTTPGGLRGLLEHVGIDVAGRVITVDGVPIDDIGRHQPATVPGVDACYSGRHCITWGFCRRCAPELAEEASRLFKATGGSSEAYAAIVKGLTETAPHSCGNCEGVDPATCLNNPTRTKE